MVSNKLPAYGTDSLLSSTVFLSGGGPGYSGRTGYRKIIKCGTHSSPEVVESHVLVFDEAVGGIVEEVVEHVRPDESGRYVSPAKIQGRSWGGYEYTAESGRQCVNPWMLHSDVRWCCIGMDGLLTRLEASAFGGGGAPLCLRCYRRNEARRFWSFFGVRYY